MPIGKVLTEELFMEGTHSGGSYGEVSSQQDHRSKHYSSRSKHHNHNYTRYSPRCKYHSPRHTLSKETECIADIFYQKSPTPCSRHKVFLQKGCIADRNTYPELKCHRDTWKLAIKGVSQTENITSAPLFSTWHRLFIKKGCIADKMTRIPPISSSRYRFFPPKGCVADRKHIPWTKKLPQYMKTDPWGCVADRHRSLTAKRLTVKEHLKSVYHWIITDYKRTPFLNWK